MRIGARYDALNDQILLNGVVQGTGGYVYLNGKIISTSTSGLAQGEIVVNGGAGTVNVVNSTGVTLVTNTVNTGVTAASVVQLVDRLKNETTWYVYNAGSRSRPTGRRERARAAIKARAFRTRARAVRRASSIEPRKTCTTSGSTPRP